MYCLKQYAVKMLQFCSIAPQKSYKKLAQRLKNTHYVLCHFL